METVDMTYAQKHFSKLLDRVQAGEEVIIAESGTPKAKLIPIKQLSKTKDLLELQGKISFRDDYDHTRLR